MKYRIQVTVGVDLLPGIVEAACERYGSWKAAEAGHKRFVKKYLIDAKTRVKASDDD